MIKKTTVNKYITDLKVQQRYTCISCVEKKSLAYNELVVKIQTNKGNIHDKKSTGTRY